MAVAGDGQPFEGAVRPGVLDRSRHGGRGLARAENDGAAVRAGGGFSGQFGQRGRQAPIRSGYRNGFVQQAAQQSGRIESLP